MNAEMPLATLRLTCPSLDPDKASRILLRDEGGAVRPLARHLEIKSRDGVWLASTDKLGSRRAQDHLRSLVDLLLPSLSEIEAAFPGVAIDFSLLAFDPAFSLGDLPQQLLSTVTEIGRLEVEMPTTGKGAAFTAGSFEEYAV